MWQKGTYAKSGNSRRVLGTHVLKMVPSPALIEKMIDCRYCWMLYSFCVLYKNKPLCMKWDLRKDILKCESSLYEAYCFCTSNLLPTKLSDNVSIKILSAVFNSHKDSQITWHLYSTHLNNLLDFYSCAVLNTSRLFLRLHHLSLRS